MSNVQKNLTMNYKIIYNEENSLLGIRDGFSYKEIDRGSISETNEMITVTQPGGQKNVYFIKDENLIAGPKGINADENEREIRGDSYFFQRGFDYGIFQISSQTEKILGSYSECGLFYKETAEGVKLSYLTEEPEVVEIPFISRDVFCGVNRLSFQFIALGDGSYRVLEMDYEEVDGDYRDYHCPYLDERMLPVIIIPTDGKAMIYVYNEHKNSYTGTVEENVLCSFANAIVVGTKDAGELYSLERGVKKFVAAGLVTEMSEHGVVIGGQRYAANYNCLLNFTPVQPTPGNAGDCKEKGETAYLSQSLQKESKSHSFWDFLLPWRWFS